jgi:hypothetical protein
MSLLAAFLLTAALCILAWTYPAIIIAVYMMFAISEIPSMGSAFGHYTRIPPFGLKFLCLAIAFREYYKIWLGRNSSPEGQRSFVISTLAVLIAAWIGFSVYTGGVGIVETLISVIDSGVLGVILAVAFHRDQKAMFFIVLTVLAQLLISYGVVNFNSGPLGSLSFADSILSADSLGVSYEKVTRTSAQFHNSIPLGFYGAISFLIGAYFFLYSGKILLKTLAFAFILLGAWSSFVTIQRAIWVGILIGMVFLLKPVSRKVLGKLLIVSYVAGLGFLIYTLMSTENKALNVLSDFFLETRKEEYRVMAAINSIDILFSKPMLGNQGDILEQVRLAGGAPHQFFYFLAVLYGIPAGLFAVILMFIVIKGNFVAGIIRGNSGLSAPETYLGVALGWAMLSMSLSNNMSAGMLGWLCLGYACLPWVYARSGELCV